MGRVCYSSKWREQKCKLRACAVLMYSAQRFPNKRIVSTWQCCLLGDREDKLLSLVQGSWDTSYHQHTKLGRWIFMSMTLRLSSFEDNFLDLSILIFSSRNLNPKSTSASGSWGFLSPSIPWAQQSRTSLHFCTLFSPSYMSPFSILNL